MPYSRPDVSHDGCRNAFDYVRYLQDFACRFSKSSSAIQMNGLSTLGWAYCSTRGFMPPSMLMRSAFILGCVRTSMMKPERSLVSPASLLHSLKSSDWVVHVFFDTEKMFAQYHGKSFISQRFHTHKTTWPRAKLLLWHHQQCVLKHLRGYAHRMTAADELRLL